MSRVWIPGMVVHRHVLLGPVGQGGGFVSDLKHDLRTAAAGRCCRCMDRRCAAHWGAHRGRRQREGDRDYLRHHLGFTPHGSTPLGFTTIISIGIGMLTAPRWRRAPAPRWRLLLLLLRSSRGVGLESLEELTEGCHPVPKVVMHLRTATQHPMGQRQQQAQCQALGSCLRRSGNAWPQ